MIPKVAEIPYTMFPLNFGTLSPVPAKTIPGVPIDETIRPVGTARTAAVLRRYRASGKDPAPFSFKNSAHFGASAQFFAATLRPIKS